MPVRLSEHAKEEAKKLLDRGAYAVFAKSQSGGHAINAVYGQDDERTQKQIATLQDQDWVRLGFDDLYEPYP